VRDDNAWTGRASASENGRFLAFPRYEFGGGGIWIRDLTAGRERQLAATPRVPLNPVISVDGRWVAYTVTMVNLGGAQGPGVSYVVETAGGAPRRVCDNCQIYQWSRDNSQLFIVERRTQITRLDLASGSRTPVVAAVAGPNEVDDIDRPLLAPNERWMVFNSGRRVFVAPLYPDRATPETEWITVHRSTGAERSAGVSPDGGLLYLLLERDAASHRVEGNPRDSASIRAARASPPRPESPGTTSGSSTVSQL
jgi:hypothetical protein